MTRMTGGCQCGRVRYAAEVDSDDAYLCHCRMCQRATGGVCDGNNIAACGVPVVDTMGARGGAIHSGEEYLIVDSLAERAALSAVTMLRIAEGRL